MKIEDFRFLEIQIVFFFKPFLQSEGLTLFNEIKKETGKIFNDLPLTIPLPDNAPKEIPFINVDSDKDNFDDELKLSLSRDRAIISYSPSSVEDKNKNFDFHIEKIKKILSDVFKVLIRENKIKRIGFITRYFLLDDNPDEVIKNSFTLGMEKYKDLKELYIKFNKPFSADDFKFNKIKTINSNNLTIDEGIKRKGVLISLDINTNQKVDYDDKFKEEGLDGFLRVCKDNNFFNMVNNLIS